MEISKNIELDNGVIVSYWKPVSMSINFQRKTGIVEIGGWLNSSAYENSKEPVIIKNVSFDAVDFIDSNSATLESLFLKIYNQFKDYFAIE